jgi:hypothetical protein
LSAAAETRIPETARATAAGREPGVPGEIDDYPQRFVVAFRQPTKEVRGRPMIPNRRASVRT